MDAHLDRAARALAVFDPLEALRYVTRRRDPPAVALRGIAHAQLGEFASARRLLSQAARSVAAADPALYARAVAAEAEVALACRDVAAAGRGFDAALRALQTIGDHENARFVRLQQVRRLIIVGDLRGAEQALSAFEGQRMPARAVAVAELIAAELALRRLRSAEARGALARARIAIRVAKLPPLAREADRVATELDAPVARLVQASTERVVTLDDVESLLGSGDVLIDGCRREVRRGAHVVSLATRPVLFALATALGRASPGDVNRATLISCVFGGKSSESHRARLRVEIGRLRALLAGIADVRATPLGYSMIAKPARPVRVLLPPVDGDAGALLGLLASGGSWSTSALATALAMSQRSVQRGLTELSAAGTVVAAGRGRSRRWVAKPLVGFATTLLLAARPSSE